MARRRRRGGTKRGMRRRTARKAYFPKTRRRRRYGSRRGRVSVRRRRGGSNGMIKAGTKSALTDIGYMAAGAATTAVVEKYAADMMPFNAPGWTVGAILGGYGIYKNDKKMIYAGFGAVMDKVRPAIKGFLP